MLVGSIAKLLANVSAPIAALFALGYLAQVVNIWRVAYENYEYGFITAWHVASVIDRTVVIGIGLKYLVFSWAFVVGAVLVVWLLMRAFATLPDGPVPSSWVFFIVAGILLVGWLFLAWVVMRKFAKLPDDSVLSIGVFFMAAGILLVGWLVVWLLMRASPAPPDGSVPSSSVIFIGGPTPVYIGGQVPPTSNDTKADPSSWWLGSILLAAVLAIVWLFFVGWKYPTPAGEKAVLSYLPYVNMTVTGSTEAASSSVASDGQPFTGTANPSNNGKDGTYTVTGSIDPVDSNPQYESKPKEIEGILLSHNADFWYIFAEEVTKGEEDRRRILVIPADEASETCVVKEDRSAEERDCTY